MHAGGGAIAQRCALEGWNDALLVHRMARFVQSREQAVAHVVGRKRVVMRTSPVENLMANGW